MGITKHPYQTGYSLATLPIRPLGLASQAGKKGMQAMGPAAKAIGDIGVHVAAPLLANAANDAASGLTSMAGTALTEGAGDLGSAAAAGIGSLFGGPAGTAVGGGIGQAATKMGDIMTAAAPMVGNIAGKLAVPAAQAAGSAAWGLGTAGLDLGSKMAGVFPDHPEMANAMDQYAGAQIAPRGLGGIAGGIGADIASNYADARPAQPGEFAKWSEPPKPILPDGDSLAGASGTSSPDHTFPAYPNGGSPAKMQDAVARGPANPDMETALNGVRQDALRRKAQSMYQPGMSDAIKGL